MVKLQDVETTAWWHNVYLGTSITFLASTIVFMSLYFADSCSTTPPTAPIIYNTSIVVESAATSSGVIGMPNCLTLSKSTVDTVEYGFVCSIDLGPAKSSDIIQTPNNLQTFSVQHFETINDKIKLYPDSGNYQTQSILQCCCNNQYYNGDNGEHPYNDLCHVDQAMMPRSCDDSSLTPPSKAAPICISDGTDQNFYTHSLPAYMKIESTGDIIKCVAVQMAMRLNMGGWIGITRKIEENWHLIMSCGIPNMNA